PLPYAFDALEPFISKETLNYHYGKHHAGYVKKLNLWLEANPSIAAAPPALTDLLTTKTFNENKGVFNNAAQDWNHQFYWKSMAPASASHAVPAALDAAISKAFGSFDAFKEKFSTVAAGHFGYVAAAHA
ncbi:hypothetical protein HDU91_007122, partial [Kappamyces sp. JEL0680]